MRPTYRADLRRIATPALALAPTASFHELEGGVVSIGTSSRERFHFDNESPQHARILEPFAISARKVSCGEYIEFIEDGGYEKPALWLSLGWDWLARTGTKLPLYWDRDRRGFWLMTLAGYRPIDRNEPVCHVSYFEADAFARWRGARLPTETEWEHAFMKLASADTGPENFLESDVLHPSSTPMPGFAGDAWEWTSSPYSAYPGYRPPEGALGEYNGKFMCNQYVLRGGSCATPRRHFRPTYRNFLPPEARWQFSGFRVAKEIA